MARLRCGHVKTNNGKLFWSVAFTSDDLRDGPTNAPPEEKYKTLRELLQKKDPSG